MKLNYRTDIRLFLLFCALIVNTISLETDLLSQLNSGQLGPGQIDYAKGVVEKFDTLPHLIPREGKLN
jgi:hypothetical protein